MCGIAGIVRFNPRDVVEEARLKRMRDVLRHRGPDGEGLWIDGPVGLAHRRLAIVDVAGGQQPMANEDDTVWITYNGEIYNHAALRPGLEANGHRYRTRSDTETILHLYEEEADRCVESPPGHVRLRPLGPTAASACSSRATGSASSPSTTASPTGSCSSRSEIKAILAATGERPALNARRAPGVPRDALPGRGGDVLPGHPEAAARAHPDLVAGRRARSAGATGPCPPARTIRRRVSTERADDLRAAWRRPSAAI